MRVTGGTMDERSLASLVGANIAERRRQLGWTQEQLAERLNLSQESLSRMEKGVIAPKFSRLQGMADILGCKVSELFHSAEESEGFRQQVLEQRLAALPARRKGLVLDVLAVIVGAFEEENSETSQEN